MATPIIMPRQGNTVESCIISEWHKKIGDKVSKGDILFTYETDKASFDEESSVDGILLDIFFQVDDEVPVLTNVCVIGQEGENIDEFTSGTTIEKAEEATKSAEIKTEEEPVSELTAQITRDPNERLKISPRAKNLADKELVDPNQAQASGPYGRIIEKDIVKLAASGQKATRAASDVVSASDQSFTGTGLGGRVTLDDTKLPVTEEIVPSFEDVKLSNIRKIIARSMHASLSTTAQLTLNSSFDATAILEFRKQLKSADIEGMPKITINDIILFAVSRVIKNHKDLNAHFLDDKIRYFNNVNLGVAVDTPRGLLVPTLFNADSLTLSSLAVESKKIISSSIEGTISPDSLSGATFTLTNLGTLGVESFTPVINPPQTGILGINNIVYRQKKTDTGFETYPAMGLSLTFDHRALDGAPAAKFLKDLVDALENFLFLLI